MRAAPVSSAAADTHTSCPARWGRFTDQEGSTRNTESVAAHTVLKKGVMEEIQPTAELHRP